MDNPDQGIGNEPIGTPTGTSHAWRKGFRSMTFGATHIHVSETVEEWRQADGSTRVYVVTRSHWNRNEAAVSSQLLGSVLYDSIELALASREGWLLTKDI